MISSATWKKLETGYCSVLQKSLTFTFSSGSSGRVEGGAEKHEIYMAAFGGNLFYDLFLQGPHLPPGSANDIGLKFNYSCLMFYIINFERMKQDRYRQSLYIANIIKVEFSNNSYTTDVSNPVFTKCHMYSSKTVPKTKLKIQLDLKLSDFFFKWCSQQRYFLVVLRNIFYYVFKMLNSWWFSLFVFVLNIH